MLEENVLKNIKVLYVEDEPITRNQVSRFLKKKIGKIVVAENGCDGIRKFLEHQPDVIITDLIMPDMNGIEMMKKIRGDGYRCPFIITSALSDSKIILETVDLRIEQYLIKPIDINVLMDRLIQIAIDKVENKNDLLVINHEFILSDDKKNELEFKIRNLYSSFLKKTTGKGAKLIEVFIRGKEIEIIAKENLTIIEESFLKAGNHFKSIEIIRKTIYENTIKEVEDQIETLIGRRVAMINLEIHPKEAYEKIVLKIQ
ncbi:response regulator [Alkaliphilus transvaalensis]|uniref:response regulator n=1 Tax=Alkaliphilus transvaalensis TaxID=114628 RepID=UPI0004798CC4|nr:response regulator [Alkaliphilus transvaalensis]